MRALKVLGQDEAGMYTRDPCRSMRPATGTSQYCRVLADSGIPTYHLRSRDRSDDWCNRWKALDSVAALDGPDQAAYDFGRSLCHIIGFR